MKNKPRFRKPENQAHPTTLKTHLPTPQFWFTFVRPWAKSYSDRNSGDASRAWVKKDSAWQRHLLICLVSLLFTQVNGFRPLTYLRPEQLWETITSHKCLRNMLIYHVTANLVTSGLQYPTYLAKTVNHFIECHSRWCYLRVLYRLSLDIASAFRLSLKKKILSKA